MQRRTIHLFATAALLVGACADVSGSELPESTAAAAESPSYTTTYEADEADAQDEQAEAETTSEGAEGAAEGALASQEPKASGAAGQPDTWQGMRVGTNFWFLAEWGENAFKPGVDFATTDNPWNEAFLSDLEEANYAVYRTMDFGGTNHSKIREWSERTQMNSPDNLLGGNVGGRGIAYEWMFDLCNRMQKDCWINVPHLAIESYEKNPDNNFFTELAKLAKEQLDPGLDLYIEYSNETWNYGFEQALYCKDRGAAMGLDQDPYAANFKFHVYASSRMNDAFVKVFGADSARVRWVVAGQLDVPFGTEKQVDALKDPKMNLGGRMPAFYSVSNYVGPGDVIDGASPTVEADFRKELQRTIDLADMVHGHIDPLGIPLVAYEGGQHSLRNADVLSTSPAIYGLYKEWLDAVSSRYVLTMHYGNSGAYKSDGAWGAKSVTGQPLAEAPKARALVEWIAAHPTE